MRSHGGAKILVVFEEVINDALLLLELMEESLIAIRLSFGMFVVVKLMLDFQVFVLELAELDSQ